MSEFGDIVRRRRSELGLTQHEVTSRGGPSHQTLRLIERSDVLPPLREFTALRLDRALDWEPGSAKAAIENGTLPRPVSDSFGPDPGGSGQGSPRPTHERYGNAGRNFSIRLPSELAEAVAARAAAEGTTSAAVIRSAVSAYMWSQP